MLLCGLFGWAQSLQYVVSALPHGEVYLAKHRSTDVTYTLRQEVKDSLEKGGERQRLERELSALRAINEAKTQCAGLLPTLLRAFETSGETSFLRGSGSVYLLLQQRAVCDLGTILDAHDGSLGEPAARFVGACVAQALDVLHHQAPSTPARTASPQKRAASDRCVAAPHASAARLRLTAVCTGCGQCNLIYRNLSPESLHLLENGYVCLLDLRFARRDDGSCQTLCGPVNTYAPEQLRGEVYGPSVDWCAASLANHRHDRSRDRCVGRCGGGC